MQTHFTKIFPIFVQLYFISGFTQTQKCGTIRHGKEVKQCGRKCTKMAG